MPTLKMKNSYLKILGYSALFTTYIAISTPKADAIITHALTYTTTNASSTPGTLSGFVTFDETDAAASSNVFTQSLSGQNFIRNIVLTFSPTGGGADTTFKFTPPGTNQFASYNYNTGGNTINFNNNLIGQLSNLQFNASGLAIPTAGDTAFELNYDSGEYLLSSTTALPGPLPFLSFLPIISFAKKLKKYII